MTEAELRAKPFGSVVWAMNDNTHWRKGPRDTWHPILQNGHRIGQRNAIRSAYLENILGPVNDTTAETERLSHIKQPH